MGRRRCGVLARLVWLDVLGREQRNMQAEILPLPHVAHERRRLLAFVQRGRALAARAPAHLLHEGRVGGALSVSGPVDAVSLLRVVEALGHARHLLGPPPRHVRQVAGPSHLVRRRLRLRVGGQGQGWGQGEARAGRGSIAP